MPYVPGSIRGIQIKVNDHIATSSFAAVSVYDTECLFIIKYARPGNDLARLGQSEWRLKIGDFPLVFTTVPQDWEFTPNICQGRNPYVSSRFLIETMGANCSKRTEAR